MEKDTFLEDRIMAYLLSGNETDKGMRLLMDTYQERLYQVIRRLVIGHEETHDVLQNTFVKVFRNIEKFERKSSLFSWIYRIATNEALRLLEKEKKHRHQQGLDETQQLEASESNFSAEEVQDRLWSALRTLPDKQRLVFQLRYYEEMTYQTMSEVLDTSEGALKASYHHAVKKVEQHLLKNL